VKTFIYLPRIWRRRTLAAVRWNTGFSVRRRDQEIYHGSVECRLPASVQIRLTGD